MSDDDFESEFVSYTPLSRKRVLTPPSSRKKSITFGSLPLKRSPNKVKKETLKGNVCKDRKLKCESSVKSEEQPTKPDVKIKTTESINLSSQIKKVEDDGCCPSCQMPWTYYKNTGKPFELHVDQCLSHDLKHLPECRDGAACSEVMQDHFWKFSHFLLADVRAYGKNSKMKFQNVNKYEPEVILEVKSEKEDLVFENGIDEGLTPGPSGWKLVKVEAVNSDEILSESCSTIVFDKEKEQEQVFDMSSVARFDMEATLNRPEVERIGGDSVGDSDVTLGRDSCSNLQSVEKSYQFKKRRTNFTTECGPSNNATRVDVHREETLSVKEGLEDGDKCSASPSKCSASPGIFIDSDDDELFTSLVDEALVKYLNRSEEAKEADIENVNHIEEVPSELPRPPSQNKKCHNSSQEKKCVHIHFHISPGKSKNRPANQPSILNFFSPKKKTPTAVEVPAESHKSTDENKKGELKGPEAWNSLMNRMRQKGYSMPPVTQTDSNASSGLSEQSSRSSQYGKGGGGQQRKCPFYKFIPDTSFVVDAFNYGYQDGITGYFLTHYHYDHFRGLTRSFQKPVYCNRITGNLVRDRIKLPDKFLRILPMEEPTVVCGVEVTLLEANHCPGAAMILFKLLTGQTILHVGDFRAHPKMESYPALWNNPIHTLYLDTTYCNPMYSFPNQEEVIDKCVLVAVDHNQQNPKSMFAVGSYTIGKERVFKAIAEALNCKIWVSTDKRRILSCIEDQEILNRITTDKLEARVHVLPMREMNPRSLNDYLQILKPRYDTVIGIKPTGWEHANNVGESLDDIEPRRQGSVFLYGIPYSEHSSYDELKRFVQFLQPKRIIPTVNVGNPQTRKKMEADFQKWMQESPFNKFGINGCFQQMQLKMQNTRHST